MNSTELYIAASEAIRYYQMTHSEPCILYIENSKVICVQAKLKSRFLAGVLCVSTFEMKIGLTGDRWNAIGKALLELLVKEQKCQESQKH